MESYRDYILRYGVIHGRRFHEKDKMKFLRSASTQMSEMGYSVDIRKAEISLPMKNKQTFYNLYAGDIEHADYVITTYYDTAPKAIVNHTQFAFETGVSKRNVQIQTFIALLLLLAIVAVSYFVFVPKLQQSGFWSLWGMSYLAFLLTGLFSITRIRTGISNRNNFVRNTSSIISMFHIAQKIKNKTVAYAFIDGGTTTNTGLQMLKEVAKHAKIIYLDSVGNPGDVIVVSKDHKFEGVINHSVKDNIADVMIGAGEWSDGNILIPNANTSKDKDVDIEVLKSHTETCTKIIKEYI